MKTQFFAFFLLSIVVLCNNAVAQSDTARVRSFERTLSEWKSDGYNTGSVKYAALRALLANDCQMADRCARGYIEQYNASGRDIGSAAWLQYIKANQISITLRDLEEKQDEDGKHMVFCWIKYAQPHSQDKEDFVGFEMTGGKISYLYNDDRERQKRERSSATQQSPSRQSGRRSRQASTGTDGNDQHQFVDLGLPSGTLWATTNIGAINPEDHGNYFAWGETAAKTSYNWFSYKFSNGESDQLTKYCTKAQCGNNGFVDSKTVLDRSDDAATASWGTRWCMPTMAQIHELKDYCAWTWAALHGREGYWVEGPNGNKIFLPASGCRMNSNLNNNGVFGFYWSSSLNVQSPHNALYMHFGAGGITHENFNYSRFYGFVIRPVRR